MQTRECVGIDVNRFMVFLVMCMCDGCFSSRSC